MSLDDPADDEIVTDEADAAWVDDSDSDDVAALAAAARAAAIAEFGDLEEFDEEGPADRLLPPTCHPSPRP